MVCLPAGLPESMEAGMNNLEKLKESAEIYGEWRVKRISDFKLIKFQKEIIEEYQQISGELLSMLREVVEEINIIPCTCGIKETGDINGACPRCNYHSRELIAKIRKYTGC
jgi:hypothetical protein